MNTSKRALLLLDVDGPLNPFEVQPRTCPAGYTSHLLKPANWVNMHGGDPEQVPFLRVDLNPAHGPALAALPFELVWATSWMGQANDMIGPAVGLPQLPYIDWGETLFVRDPDGLHWKTRALVAYAAGRPFVWVDDEPGDRDREWVAENHAGPALVHTVSAEFGLTDDDFALLRTWADDL